MLFVVSPFGQGPSVVVRFGLFELCCGCLFSAPLPRGAVRWSVVSD